VTFHRDGLLDNRLLGKCHIQSAIPNEYTASRVCRRYLGLLLKISNSY
jgi:hypothetical protein